jgi:DNA-binding response OmpR family regulator
MALRRDGYETDERFSGQAALEYLTTNKPDLILLDVMMADMNGFDVVRKLRTNPDHDKIPVVFLTARVDAISQKTGMEIGVVDYLTKPITPDVLVERVREILSTHHA